MNKTLKFISDSLIGFFLGGVVDYFAETNFIFSFVGLCVGIFFALILNIISNKKEKKK